MPFATARTRGDSDPAPIPVPPPVGCPSLVFDDFERTQSGWGPTASGGNNWITPAPTGLSVAGGNGIMDLATSGSNQNEASTHDTGIWNTSPSALGSFFLRVPFQLSSVGPHSGTKNVDVVFGFPENTEHIFCAIRFADSASPSVTLTLGGISAFTQVVVTPDAPHAFDTTYQLVWEYNFLAGTSSAKLWLDDGRAEPAYQNVVLTTNDETNTDTFPGWSIFCAASNAGWTPAIRFGQITFEEICDALPVLAIHDFNNRNSSETWFGGHDSIIGDQMSATDFAPIASASGNGPGLGGTARTGTTEVYISHDAPLGATNGHFRANVTVEANYGGETETTDVLVAWRLDTAFWGSSPPTFGMSGGGLASGSLLPGATAAIDVIIPVVAGRIQFVWKTGTLVTPTNGLHLAGGGNTAQHVSVTAPGTDEVYVEKVLMPGFFGTRAYYEIQYT